MFSTKARNAEILLGGFNDHFTLRNVLIIHEFLTVGYPVFWTTVPVSRGSYSIPKQRELVHNKSETSFRIASHFWTNIEYSHRVQTSIFVETILEFSESWYRSQRTNFSEVSKHRDFIVCPSSKITSTTKPKSYLKSLDISKQRSTVQRTWEGLDEFLRGNSKIISDCWLCSILKTLPGCRLSRHYENKYMLFAGWEVCMVKNCDRGLEMLSEPEVTVFHYTDRP